MTDLILDKDGYLADLSHWNETVAHQLAANHNVELTKKHWEIIQLLRQFYSEFDHAPSQRPFVKYIASHLGKDKGNSMYLMKLFPESPAKLAALIAGLPRPTNCF
ncbi:sulfurtransferase TusE [Endozoicomonas montiporae]|uniref:Sulfurtransferase n=2 Tax=Endozoicomonas montiporae TaxID=1027273 RepID=A0A081NAX5_9GAMM|nr:TusE/DsrC/DsvC family sulfur relay protein [Endozoicomonas montiporae]AMO56701.1 dissimilatory sulfite reductase (desulfoviridin) subunit gamma [Endozoicomonas montiporae CL-33]KEQ15598.1 sulfurtransferase TusE [Endozoicomonas montiporae]